jgi:hypothetical protein
MEYALLIYTGTAMEDFEQRTEDEQQAILAEYRALTETPGVIASRQLQPPETASTVRVENLQPLITDGPFPDVKEALGGLYLIEAEDLDAALEIAARIPAARRGGVVEVRPVVQR